MNFKTFIIGLIASFGAAFFFMIVLPFASTQELKAIEYSADKDGKDGEFSLARSGQVASGARVYAANGCYACHSQLIRPTYAGTDVWNASWAGKDADSARETTAFDYSDETYAQVGTSRTGPDLSNVGYRIEAKAIEAGLSPEAWAYQHLYEPSAKPETPWSNCTASKHFFKVKEVRGQGSADAVEVSVDTSCGCWKGKEVEVIPSGDAQALVSYLLSMKKDNKLPFELDPNPKKKAAEN